MTLFRMHIRKAEAIFYKVLKSPNIKGEALPPMILVLFFLLSFLDLMAF